MITGWMNNCFYLEINMFVIWTEISNEGVGMPAVFVLMSLTPKTEKK